MSIKYYQLFPSNKKSQKSAIIDDLQTLIAAYVVHYVSYSVFNQWEAIMFQPNISTKHWAQTGNPKVTCINVFLSVKQI